MANFKYSLTSELKNNETPEPQFLDRKVALADANEKIVADHVLAAGAFDLAPVLAAIGDVKAILIKADGDGFKLKFDGVATFTAKAVKSIQLEIAPAPTGVLDIELDMVGASQRLQVLAIGD